MRNLSPNPGRHRFQITLQRDDHLERCGCLRLEPEGVVFRSPMRIALMVDLVIRIDCLTQECGCRPLKLEGTVVGCEKCADGGFEISVLFLLDEGCDLCKPIERNGAPEPIHLLN